MFLIWTLVQNTREMIWIDTNLRWFLQNIYDEMQANYD